MAKTPKPNAHTYAHLFPNYELTRAVNRALSALSAYLKNPTPENWLILSQRKAEHQRIETDSVFFLVRPPQLPHVERSARSRVNGRRVSVVSCVPNTTGKGGSYV